MIKFYWVISPQIIKICGFFFPDSSYVTNNWIPGIDDLKLNDLPGIYRTTYPNDFLLDYVPKQIEAASKASAIILPTFNALEPQVLNSLSSTYPKLYTIGPIDSLLNNQPPNSSENKNNICEFIKCNLWKEESECLKWLDTKKANSVQLMQWVQKDALWIPKFWEALAE